MTRAVSPPPSLVAPSSALQPWIVVFAAACFFFFEFMQVNMFNALDPFLFKSFHLTDSVQLGHLSANYFYANVIFLFPAGIILDRVSTRRLIIVAMAVCVTCTLAFSYAHALWQAELCRFITGIGGAFCLLSSVRLASRWFPPEKMALVVGLIVTFAMTGAMIAQTPFTLVAQDFGWRKTVFYDALLGYGLLMIIIFCVKDFPKGMSSDTSTSHESLYAGGVWFSISQALKNPQNWLAGIYASTINLPVFIMGNWGVMYLHQIHHISRESASFVTMTMFIGLIVGSTAFGMLSDQLRQRRVPMIWGAVFSLIIILAIMFWQTAGYWEMLSLFFLLGFAISAQIIAYALVAESNPEWLTGASEGLASVLIMSGGFLVPVFTRLLDLKWQHQYVHGFPVYSLSAYHLGFSMIPVAFVIGLLAALLAKETHGRSLESRGDM